MGSQIRTAGRQDAAAIADILRNQGIFERLNRQAPEETCAQVEHELALCQADDSHTVYVAEGAGGQVEAYAAVHWLPYLMHAGPEGYISELFVRDTARGQGLGGQLLETVIVEARRRGCTRLALLNMRGRESYQRGFYAKHGWQERPEAANFIYWLDEGKH